MKKVIQINNKKQLKHFYHSLFFYKSFLFHFVSFEIDSNYPLSDFTDYLNMKNRKQRIIYAYDQSCKQIDEFYQDKNVCEFENGRCMVQRKKNNKFNGCCRCCRYQTCTGCPTKNLTCKLFYCSSVREKYQTLTSKDIPLLNCFSISQRAILRHNYFSSRKDIIKDLFIGSVIIFIPRIVYRQIRNQIYRKRHLL